MRLTEEDKGLQVARVLNEKKSVLEEKNREIENITATLTTELMQLRENITQAKWELGNNNEKMEKMQKYQEKLNKQLLIKDTEIFNLKEALEDVKRKTEFKSNLERSFEFLQNQFQMKVDEIERLKKRLGIDEKNRRPSREKKIV